jgi:hypothetical protein
MLRKKMGKLPCRHFCELPSSIFSHQQNGGQPQGGG